MPNNSNKMSVQIEKMQEFLLRKQELYMNQQQEEQIKQQELYTKQQQEQFVKVQEQLVASLTAKWSVKEDAIPKKSPE